jgi:ribosome-binding protein aMBF1 (putative translation factor)
MTCNSCSAKIPPRNKWHGQELRVCADCYDEFLFGEPLIILSDPNATMTTYQ